jgi:hypothetical protein
MPQVFHHFCGRCLLIIITTVLFYFTSFSPTQAQTAWSGACVGTGIAADTATIQGVTCLVRNILNVALTLLSFVGFIMFVFAGGKLLIYGGQSSNLEAAKGTITFAIMGLILAVSSYVILLLVSNITGQAIMQFQFLPNTL